MASFSNTSIISPSPHRHLPVLPLRSPNLVNTHSFRFNQQQFRYFSKNPTMSAAPIPIRVSSADLEVQDPVSTSITTSWAEFAEKVSGEWDRFGAGFTADGQPVELPEQVVPEAYREPFSGGPFAGASDTIRSIASENLFLIDLDPATAKVAISILGPFLSAFGFLFIVRIVMSWYPKLPVEKFPYVVAYAPTEPILAQTRKVIPPLGGVDVTPVVWFGLLSFLNEILVGPQGLLVLLSQKV